MISPFVAPPRAHLHQVGQAVHVRLRPRHFGPEAAPQTQQVGGHADGQLRKDEGNEEGVEIMEFFFRNKPGIVDIIWYLVDTNMDVF